MDLGLRDKVALVSGASQGLGKAVAMLLAQEGASVAICSRRDDAIHAAARDIAQRTGTQTIGLACDVTRVEQVRSLVEQVVSSLGRVDILVTNAGGPPLGGYDHFGPEQWERAVELNLLSAVNLSVAVAPGMKERSWGRIIHIASIAAKQPMRGFILSNTVRAGVLGFSKSLSNELAPFGITVNTLCPGYTRTERIEEVIKEVRDREGIDEKDSEARLVSDVPMGRMATAEEFAALAAFLASEHAGYITGTAIQVDGGFVRGII